MKEKILNQFAVELGKLSAKSRFKGMDKTQKSEVMRKVRQGGVSDKRLTENK